MEYFKLNNGMAVPAVGFGCYNAKGGDNKKMFTEALAAGYSESYSKHYICDKKRNS